MNLNAQLKNLKAKAAALESKIARQNERKLYRLPKLAGFSSVPELIAALQKLGSRKAAGRRPRKAGKRIRLSKEVKGKLVAEALKPGSDKKALAKKYGANLNSLRVWVAQAKKAK